MRALVYDRILQLRKDYPDPQPAPGESIVQVVRAGICGTDLEITRGYMAFRGVPGHEFIGRVVQSDDRSLIGQRVAGEINAGCGRCALCAAGDARHCPDRTVIGILGRDGAFAEYLRLPNVNLIAMPEAITDEAAIFIEPLAAAYEILAQIRPSPDASMAILGDGRLGAMAALALQANGYRPVVLGHHPQKLERLERLGCVVAMAEECQGREDGRRRQDVVIDCTGRAAGFTDALGIVRPGGTIVLKSTAAADGALNLAPVVINEITIIGSRCGRFRAAIEALASGQIDPRPLLDGDYALEDGLAAFAAAKDPRNFKILLHP